MLNIAAGLCLQVLTIGLGFFSRKIFVDLLGYQILGVNGLFQNVIAILSLADLGIGTAIICNLYKPLACGDTRTICALMQFYAKVYKFLAILITALGLLAMPFVHLLINEPIDAGNLRIIFLLFISETVITYLFIHKRSLVIADQQTYLLNAVTAVIQTVLILTQIGILYWTKNYILYLSVSAALKLVENLVVSSYVRKKYAFLHTEGAISLDNDSLKNITGNVKALAFHYLALYLVRSTDNLIISSALGLTYVGMLANYQIIILAVKNLLGQFSNGIIASFGNLLALENSEKAESVFYTIFMGNFLLFNFASVALLNLTNPFLSLWLGNEALLPFAVLAWLVLDFFIHGISLIAGSLRASAGVFQQDRYLHLGTSLLKLLLSIILVREYGIAGVIAGTAIYRFLEWHCILAWILHGFVFKSSLWPFVKNSFLIAAVVVVSQICSWVACEKIVIINPWSAWWTKACICCILPNIIALLFLYRTDHMKSLLSRVKRAF